MNRVTLNNGVTMPQLGFGISQTAEPCACQRCAEEAIGAGFRLVDVAACHAGERAVGAAIAACEVARDELFVTAGLRAGEVGHEGARRAFDASLERLGLDYLDLYLVPPSHEDVHGAWWALEELYEEGVVRALGTAGFSPERLGELAAFHEVEPAVSLVEGAPWRRQCALQACLRTRGIALGIRMVPGEGCCGSGGIGPGALAEVAAAHGRAPTQVALRWQIQRGIVCIVPDAGRTRMEEALATLDFTLSEAEMARIVPPDAEAPGSGDTPSPRACAGPLEAPTLRP